MFRPEFGVSLCNVDCTKKAMLMAQFKPGLNSSLFLNIRTAKGIVNIRESVPNL